MYQATQSCHLMTTPKRQPSSNQKIISHLLAAMFFSALNPWANFRTCHSCTRGKTDDLLNFHVKFNVLELVRLRAITTSLGQMSDEAEPITNAPILEDSTLDNEEHLDSAVSEFWPDVDFLCFQEVWDRFFTAALIRTLRPRLKHFVVDVAMHSFRTNLYFGSECVCHVCLLCKCC